MTALWVIRVFISILYMLAFSKNFVIKWYHLDNQKKIFKRNLKNKFSNNIKKNGGI